MKFTSLTKLLAFGTGLILIGCLALIIIPSIFMSQRLSKKQATETMYALAANEAQRAKSQINTLLGETRAIAHAMEPMIGQMIRSQARNMLWAVVERNKEIDAAYAVFEADAFGGGDLYEKGKKDQGSHTDGRFMPLIALDADAKAVVSTPTRAYVDTPQAREFQVAYQLLKDGKAEEALVGPYLQPLAGRQQAVISALVPVKNGHSFLGFIGLDLSLEDIQNELEASNTMDGAARLLLLNYDGRVAGDSRSNKQGDNLLLQNISELLADYKTKKTEIQAGNAVSVDKAGT